MNGYLSAPQLVFSRNNARGRPRADGSNKLKARIADLETIYITTTPHDIRYGCREPFIVNNDGRSSLQISKYGVVLLPDNKKYAKKYAVAIIRAVPHKIYHCGYINGVNYRRCYNLHTMCMIMNGAVKRLQIPDNGYFSIDIHREDIKLYISSFTGCGGLRVWHREVENWEDMSSLLDMVDELRKRIENIDINSQIHELMQFLNKNQEIECIMKIMGKCDN